VARTVTRAQLRKMARLYADQRPGGGSTFVTDEEYNDLLNLAAPELYDRIIAASGPDYFEEEDTSITTVAGTASYSLPATFYQLNACDLRWSVSPLRLEPVSELEHSADRYKYNSCEWGESSPKVQRIRKSLIEFFPTPTGAVTVVLRYVPTCPALTTDTSTLDGVNGWDKLIALRVAIEARAIEKVAAGDLRGLYEAELERIDQMAADRAAASAPKVRDVNPEGTTMAPWYADLPPPV
jgi:hypothetical protein